MCERYIIRYENKYVTVYKEDGEMYSRLSEYITNETNIFTSKENVRSVVDWLNSFEPISPTHNGFYYVKY